MAIPASPHWRGSYAMPGEAMHSGGGPSAALRLDLAGQTQPQERGDRRLLGTHMLRYSLPDRRGSSSASASSRVPSR